MDAQIPALRENWYFITKNRENLLEYNNKLVEFQESAAPYDGEITPSNPFLLWMYVTAYPSNYQPNYFQLTNK